MKFIMKKNGSATNFTETGDIDYDFIRWTIDDVCSYYEKHGIMTVHFWSGAGAFGKLKMGADPKKKYTNLEQRAFCAIGQNKFMHMISEEFDKRGYDAAQLLVTDEDLHEKLDDIRDFVNYCIEHKIFIIGNYNDPTNGHEVFLDNDEPAGEYAIAFGAERLVISGVAHGFWDCNKQVIPHISEVTKEHYDFCSKGNGYGTGGPVPKLEIAKKCIKANLPMHLVHKYISLEDLENNGTYFGIL
jgi:glutamate 5-kinase